ncbi:MAG: TetR/AcrR family transcriptional regulator [Steroidobacteraceae bacterium]
MSELTDRRREEKDRRRSEILDAAAAAAAEGGFDAITMDQVARRARLSRALVYVYFEDKAALYLALYERALELLLEQFARATRDAPNGLARVAAMANAYVAFSQEHGVHFEALARFEARSATDLQAVPDRCLELGDASHAHLIAAIRDGIADGTVRADVGPPDAVAVALWGFMHGVIQIAATKAGLLIHRNTDAVQLHEHALALTLRAIANVGPVPQA